MFSSPQPPANRTHRFPVSIKGIVYHNGAIVLLKNERDEWELPGGKLELAETPEACIEREIQEELGLAVNIESLLDAWVYHIFEGAEALILTYACQPTHSAEITHSPEHKAVGLFKPEEIPSLPMPDNYKRSIELYFRRIHEAG